MRLPFTLRDRPTQANFDWLLGRTRYVVRAGTGLWVFPGGTSTSSVATIAHELGRTPVAVFVQTGNKLIIGDVGALTATTFGTGAVEYNGSVVAATSVGFYWLALG